MSSVPEFADSKNFTILHGKRIFVLEKDDWLYNAIKDALESVGCEVYGYGSWIEEAMLPIAAPTGLIDAALIDCAVFSEMFSLLARLRRSYIPFVLMVSRDQVEIPTLELSRLWLLKPFTEKDVVRSIARALTGTPVPTLAHPLHALRMT